MNPKTKTATTIFIQVPDESAADFAFALPLGKAVADGISTRSGLLTAFFTTVGCSSIAESKAVPSARQKLRLSSV